MSLDPAKPVPVYAHFQNTSPKNVSPAPLATLGNLQDNLPDVPAGLHASMGFRSIFQVKYLVHHRRDTSRV